MERFEFLCSTRIIFGRGQFARLGELAGQFGGSVLLIGNGGDADEPGSLARRAGELLAAAGLKWIFLRQRGEPQVSDVERGVELARRSGADVVVGLGGGSAIDAAKAAAGVLANGGTSLDYMEVVGEGRKLTRPAVPWIAVPTTAGTGAEVTRNAVIACPERRFKASIRSEHLLARVALVDPELGVGVSPPVTAWCGMDALCQLVESYTSNAAGPMTDALAIKGIALVGRSLLRAHEASKRGQSRLGTSSCPTDLDARSDMALAALLSGIALANAGLGAVHAFAAPLGANFPVPHGVVCAALLPHVMSANVEALRRESPRHPVLSRYADIGRALAGRQSPSLLRRSSRFGCAGWTRQSRHGDGARPADLAAIGAGIRFVEDFFAEKVARLNIPPLRQFGLGRRDIPEMVELARRTSSMKYNPVSLPDDALAECLGKAI